MVLDFPSGAMRDTKIIGLITIVAASPNIGFLVFFGFSDHPSLLSWMVIEKFLTAITCISGGALLWFGGIWGNRISIVAWILIIFASCSSLYEALFQTPNQDLQLVILAKDIIIATLGGLILVLLFRGLIKYRKG
jgi:hypothetical protein